MAEEPLDRLLVRRTVSRNVVTSLFTAMEFTRSSMEQDTQKHGRLWVLMDLLAKRIELLKALDEEILQAIDLTGMEPEILSTELYLTDILTRKALFKSYNDGLKLLPEISDNHNSFNSAGSHIIKRSSILPEPNHHSTPNCKAILGSPPLSAGESVAVITACYSHPPICITSLLPASTLESVTESLAVSPNPQLTTTDAPVSSISSPTEENLSHDEDDNHTTVTDMVVQHCCYSTTSLATVMKLSVSSPCCREPHQFIRRINADVHLPIAAYSAFNDFQVRAHLTSRRTLQTETSLVNYDPVLPHHPDRYLVTRPAKPPPWLRSR